MVEADLADLIESTAELKGQLISFAQQPRFERPLRAALADAAAQEGDAFDDRAAFMVVDDFIFGHRMQDGTTIIDSFLRQSRHLTREERARLLAWRDPVEGLFEVRRQYEDSVLLLNLVDDLEYRVYSNMGPAVREAARPVRRPVPRDGQGAGRSAARVFAVGFGQALRGAPAGRNLPGACRRRVPEGAETASFLVGRTWRGVAPQAQALVLRAGPAPRGARFRQAANRAARDIRARRRSVMRAVRPPSL